MSATEEQKYYGDVIYLRDVDGTVWGEVSAAFMHTRDDGTVIRSAPATKVRHRRTGRVGTVKRVDVPTRLIRLEDDMNANGEELRQKWYPVDEFDIVGIPASPEAKRRRLAALEIERAALMQEEQLLTDAVAPPEPPPPADPPPPAPTEPTKPETPKGKGR